MNLKQNIGTTDGFIRAGSGIVAFVVTNALGEGVVDGILEVAGALLVLTAVSGFSPIYKLIGVSTNKVENDQAFEKSNKN